MSYNQEEIELMAHLMRRAGFGVPRAELEERVDKGYEATVDELVDPDKYGFPQNDEDLLFRHFPVGILPGGVTLAMAQEGQDIFHGAGVCVSCHLREGVGGGLAPNLTDDVWLHVDGEYESIVEVIMTGVPVPIEAPGPMRARGGSSITDEQVRAVAAYVYILSR